MQRFWFRQYSNRGAQYFGLTYETIQQVQDLWNVHKPQHDQLSLYVPMNVLPHHGVRDPHTRDSCAWSPNLEVCQEPKSKETQQRDYPTNLTLSASGVNFHMESRECFHLPWQTLEQIKQEKTIWIFRQSVSNVEFYQDYFTGTVAVLQTTPQDQAPKPPISLEQNPDVPDGLRKSSSKTPAQPMDPRDLLQIHPHYISLQGGYLVFENCKDSQGQTKSILIPAKRSYQILQEFGWEVQLPDYIDMLMQHNKKIRARPKKL